jgi:hypothetical protein
MMYRGCSIVLAALLASTSAEARPDAHHGAHHADHPNLVGMRAGYLTIFEGEGRALRALPGLLVGLSYERVILHDWLEVELSVPFATFGFEEPLLVMPMDLHFKIPFHPAPHVSPYVAFGPAVDVKLRPERDVFFGASSAVGTYVWSADQLGVDVEVDYNVVQEGEIIVHELLLAMGPVFRF